MTSVPPFTRQASVGHNRRMPGEWAVSVGAGSLRSADPEATHMPHAWTDGGVTIVAPFTGAHLLHLSVAGCVLNDVYREAREMGVQVDGVQVVASGDFDRSTWRSTGVGYAVRVDSPDGSAAVERLLARVDEVAEIPKAVRAGAPVSRLA